MRFFSYVLTCSRSCNDRLPLFKKHWEKVANNYIVANPDFRDNSCFQLNVVWGMNSERFPRSPWWRLGSEPTELFDKETGNHLDRRGHTACYWGHVQEWRQALGEHDADFENGAALFFEDDCNLDDNYWTRFFEGFDELPPDWDVYYTGGQLCVNERPRPPVFSKNLYHVDNVNRTHAYCVRLTSLPKIILWFEENHDWGHNFCDPKTGKSEAEVDFALGHLTEIGFLQGYALRPWACGQGAYMSMTQGKKEPARRWDL